METGTPIMILKGLAIFFLICSLAAVVLVACGGPDPTPTPVPTATTDPQSVQATLTISAVHVSATQTILAFQRSLSPGSYASSGNYAAILCNQVGSTTQAGSLSSGPGKKFVSAQCFVGAVKDSLYVNPTDFTLVGTDGFTYPLELVNLQHDFPFSKRNP